MSLVSEEERTMTDPEQELFNEIECIAANSQHEISAPAPNAPLPTLNSSSSSRISSAMMMPVDPEPHMSSQFYTFNRASHTLMVECIMAGRQPTPDEIRSVATPPVLASWRGVWKDRHEDTAYLTGWKRIQDKLQAQVDDVGNEVLFFKSNPYQFVPFIEQWGGITQQFHIGPDLKHLGHKETLERMKEVWTVGAKLYGVPESYVKVCIATCPVCGSSSSRQEQQQEAVLESGSGEISRDRDAAAAGANATASLQQSKRKRFEYTESFEVVARDVPQRLQHLAAKYKVVLCIRQKYIRYKPFLAEVKDYCCHRGGEPTGRKPGVLKRKRYMSKRCGCSFRIRAIVPITNYDEKEKTFSYHEEGVATFKLYAVHSGHEPGPHEGSARIIHRFVDPNSMSDDFERAEKEEDEARQALLRQIQELQMELGSLEQKLGNTSVDALNGICREVSATIQRLRSIDKAGSITPASIQMPEEIGMVEHWSQEANNAHDNNTVEMDAHARRPQKKSTERDATHSCARCCSREDIQVESGFCKSCENLLRQDGSLDSRDSALVDGMQVSGYCTENDKWYEGMGCGLDAAHAVELGFGHPIS